MKTTLKMVIFSLIATVLFLVPNVCKADSEVSVNDETSLKNALNNDNAVISLSSDIEISGHIAITKHITIKGNGHTIKGNWNGGSGDQSLFTALNGGSLTLENVKLADSPKYGVQAYVGGTVTLNGVTISNCKFGAVLVNGGTLDIKSVTFGSNGNNTGIEVSTSKDAATKGADPKIIMDGEIETTADCNIFYLATDENDATTKVEIENNSSNQKILFTEDGSIVLTDSENNLLFVSNAKDTLQVIGDTEVYTPNEPQKTEANNEKSKDTKDSTPKTGSVNYIAITLSIMAIAGSAVLVMKKL